MPASNKKKLQAASTKNNPRATTTATTSTSHGKSTRNSKAKTVSAVALDTGHGDADPDGILSNVGIQAKDRMVSVKKTARETAFDDLVQEDDIQAATAFRKTAQ
jgi:N-acetylmuramoyl-L-alanine amidase